jgi:hypothetical protein
MLDELRSLGMVVEVARYNIIIGVISVVILYNCVYYCDTWYRLSCGQVGVICPYVMS